ncbi:Hypothetical protein R9X50_00640300 [Acrodontium crateriforme]|uniref:Uncharacterized protein n=1 Tax=Acrodontium crateriforme TaxID=150365 RepID=A0AAQ3RDL3_9PEZI|nr:Hypothetical protein R9X50_00640300 [Acrodontium crateriforme]
MDIHGICSRIYDSASAAVKSLTVESSPPESSYFPRDARDIYKTTFLLRQRLVLDLIPQILDLAEYWTQTSVERSAKICVDDTSAAREQPYLVLPLSQHDCRWIRKICFTVESCDQGWSSYPHDHGTYVNSWTWFDAKVKGPDGDFKHMVFANVHAGRDYHIHRVQWTADSTDENEKKFFEHLLTGNELSLVPMARYAGWRNRVKNARIDVYFAAVR